MLPDMGGVPLESTAASPPELSALLCQPLRVGLWEAPLQQEAEADLRGVDTPDLDGPVEGG
eukprot:498990-Rhodomonas_salina.1